MESTMLVPQFPLLIVAKVQRELWPSLFFFMGSALQTYRSHNLALEIALARDVEERAEASNASWIASQENLTRTS